MFVDAVRYYINGVHLLVYQFPERATEQCAVFPYDAKPFSVIIRPSPLQTTRLCFDVPTTCFLCRMVDLSSDNAHLLALRAGLSLKSAFCFAGEACPVPAARRASCC